MMPITLHPDVIFSDADIAVLKAAIGGTGPTPPPPPPPTPNPQPGVLSTFNGIKQGSEEWVGWYWATHSNNTDPRAAATITELISEMGQTAYSRKVDQFTNQGQQCAIPTSGIGKGFVYYVPAGQITQNALFKANGDPIAPAKKIGIPS